MKTNPVPEKIRKFLSTPEGNRFFSEISGPGDRRKIFERKKAFLDPPANVRRWLDYEKKLKKHLE